ncbi:MAG: MgtC/SapB family protein [Paracoccaceae bacterium]|jgi:putative Mg2+ transporter-C (MgtC) family protein|nr:MgtC/SapB family protein [Paracoccaceae bacterium]
MTELSAELFGAPILSWPVLLVRLGGATLLCALIGLEREVKNRPAGLRTHILVGLASAVYTLIMVELVSRADSYPDITRTDPIRIIEAVTSGVAFLAAGMIVFTGDKVRGLTTGAGLWLSASVGLAAGLGLWPLAALSTLLALVVTRLLGSLERRGEKALVRWRGSDGRKVDGRDGDAPGR